MGELCGSTWCPACRRPARDGAEREELCRLLGYSVDVGDRDLYAHAAREVTRLRRFLETEIDVTAEVCSLSGESRGVFRRAVFAHQGGYAMGTSGRCYTDADCQCWEAEFIEKGGETWSTWDISTPERRIAAVEWAKKRGVRYPVLLTHRLVLDEAGEYVVGRGSPYLLLRVEQGIPIRMSEGACKR